MDSPNDNTFQLTAPVSVRNQIWNDGVRPLVTTHTTAYNHEKYIRDCLEGILDQKTTFRVQILVHDDASTDKTAELIREYEKKYPNIVRGYYQKKNTYKDPQKLFLRKPFYDLTEGKYIAICEGDDYWIDSLKLQKQVLFMKDNPACAGCFHACKVIYDGTDKEKIERHKGIQFLNHKVVLKKNIYIGTASLFFNATIIPDFISLGSDKFAGDFILKHLILVSGKLGYLDEVMSVYRKGVPGSWTNTELSQARIDREYLDNISVLTKINEMTDYAYRGEVLFAIRKQFIRYLSRTIVTSSFVKGISLFFYNMLNINLPLLKAFLKKIFLK